MSWTKTSRGNYWVELSESITLTSNETDINGTAFHVPPGIDFLVGAYFASAVSTTLDLDVDGSFDGTTFASDMKAAIVNDKGTSSGFFVGNYDISANGEAPYYRVRVDPNGSMAASGDVVVVKVLYNMRKTYQMT